MPDEITAPSKDELRERVRQFTQETLIQPLRLEDIDENIVSRLLTELTSSHHLDGAASPGSPPSFLFRLPENVPPSSLTHKSVI